MATQLSHDLKVQLNASAFLLYASKPEMMYFATQNIKHNLTVFYYKMAQCNFLLLQKLSKSLFLPVIHVNINQNGGETLEELLWGEKKKKLFSCLIDYSKCVNLSFPHLLSLMKLDVT